MVDLYRFSPLATIKELLALYNIKALRKLSQNFLLDRKLTDKIVGAAGNLNNHEVCEIGPGPGSITRSILVKNPKKVLAIEKDVRFKPILEALQKSSNDKLNVVYADILNFDLSEFFDISLKKEWEDEPPSINIIGNLPFNIANVLVINYLRDISLRKNAWAYGRVGLTLTFQEEVAKRIEAPIVSKHRCRLSVMCQNWCKVSHRFTIPGRAFLPKPEVNVGIVHFEPLIEPVIKLDFGLIERIVRTVFNCRQKYIINPAKHLFPLELRESLGKEMLEIAGIDPDARPYQISLEEWNRLCLAYKYICDRNPQLYAYNYRGPRNKREEIWKEAVVDEKQLSSQYSSE